MAYPLQFSSSSLALRQTLKNSTKPSLSHKTPQFYNSLQLPKWVSAIQSKPSNFLLSASLALSLSFTGVGLAEQKVGVNKPDLLPKEFTTIIDVAGFLSDGQEKRIAQEIDALEKDTGYKLRVLAQNYPDTPGLAIKDYWKVDDSTIVFVADPTFGNILHFNVGATVDLDIPHSFWSRLAGKYGNIFYWKEKGEDASIEAAVMAVSSCLREPMELLPILRMQPYGWSSEAYHSMRNNDVEIMDAGIRYLLGVEGQWREIQLRKLHEQVSHRARVEID